MRLSTLPFIFGAMVIFALPATLCAQGLAREALACFPADTVQMTYANFADLRGLPEFPQLRRVLFIRPIQQFESFLQPFGADPEKDVNEVVLGWRGPEGPRGVFFGLAQGSFDGPRIQNSMAQEKLPTRAYDGYVLSTFSSGVNPNDLFFTFLSSDLAAFGRLTDLKALIDGYFGNKATLNSDAQFVNWEGELDGSGPQWGITTGKAAANLAAPWLGGNAKKKDASLAMLFAPVKAVLYQVNWTNDFSVEIDLICQDAQSAETMERLLRIWRDSAASMNSRPADIASFVQELQIETDGRRVELTGSGSPDVLAQFLQGATAH